MRPEWNPRAGLRCVSCGAERPIGPSFGGCDACGEAAPLEVVYEPTGDPGRTPAEVVDWLASSQQPFSDGAGVELGQGDTPLLPLGFAGDNVYLKNETANPTWSHKDRVNAVNAAAASILGCEGLVATSTGNHGASVAAYAAAGGLPAVILCRQGTPETLVSMIRAYGGLPVSLPVDDSSGLLASMVDRGWFPATSMDPGSSGRGNPFGAEGYKRIALEVVSDLSGVPDAVIVPTASGDTFYGIAKGFHEVCAPLGQEPPAPIAVQPVLADPLARSVEAGSLVEVPGARSVALSIANSRTGMQALVALKRWGGRVVSVEDEEILNVTRELAHHGLLLEPAAASCLAGYRAALREQVVTQGARVVLIGTCAGVKWLDRSGQLDRTPMIDSRSGVERELARLGWITPAG